VRIPENPTIPDAKIVRYLLVHKIRNDKSKFLAQAGFTQRNPNALKVALQLQAVATDAIEDTTNEYGTFYRVISDLVGTNGVRLSIISVWLRKPVDGHFQFVTLKPFRES
jgi:hypothetical protein